MKIKISRLFISVVFAAVIFATTILFLGSIDDRIKEPGVFVENRTVLTKSDSFYNYEITKYPSKIEIVDLRFKNIGNKIGLSVDSWIFDFGIIPIGGSVKKTINFESIEDKSKVKLIAFGNISSMITFSKNNFYLKGNDKVDVLLNITESPQLGNYTGEIDIIVQKNKFS